MSSGQDQSPGLKFVVTNTLIVGDIERSVAFDRDVLGATVLGEGEPKFFAPRQHLAHHQPSRRANRRQA